MTDRSNYPADVLRRALVTWSRIEQRCPKCGEPIMAGTRAGEQLPYFVLCLYCPKQHAETNQPLP